MWNVSVNPALFSYHIHVIPEALYTFAETGVTIEILFDITYNVTIVATHLCGQAMSIILNTGLFYRELLFRVHSSTNMIVIIQLTVEDRVVLAYWRLLTT